MSCDLVSAIITTHNRVDLLPRAIDSVLSQSYSNIECVVVDDASDDDTMSYCQQRQDIVYVRLEKENSRGGNHARNVGIGVAKGELIAFLDDDDYWLPDKIKKQVEIMDVHPDRMVYCRRKIEIVDGESVDYMDDYLCEKNKGDMRNRILYTFPTVTSCILLSRDAIEKIGCFDENLRFWQESEMLIRLAQHVDFCYVDEPLVVYRLDKSDGSRLSNKFFEWRKSVEYIKNKHSELYDRLSCKEKLLVLSHVYSDAANRAKACGLTFRYVLYSVMLLPLRVVRKIDTIL